MNQVGLVGRITRDPVLKTLPSNRHCVRFVVAVNRNFRNHQGEIEADFVSCIAWGKLAERIVQYCGKGSLISVKGKLQSNFYMTKENIKVYTTDVTVDDVRFLVLKQPSQSSSNNTSEQQIPENFVLPKEEEALPIP